MILTLAAAEYGSGDPVAILHGLLGAGRNWAGIARRLAPRRRVIVFDLRNHGASPWAPSMSYAEMAADVLAAMAQRGHRIFDLIGHSMGGKVAMVAALTAGTAIERLVVVDIAPVVYPYDAPSDRPPPGPSSYVRAMRDLDLAAVGRRGDADRLLAARVPDLAERAFLLQNLLLGDGAARWQSDLAAIEKALPALSGFPSLPADAAFPGPTLFVAGANSAYLRPEHEAGINRLFPAAEFTRIAGAGHWVHAEQPDAFLAAVEPFLAGHAT